MPKPACCQTEYGHTLRFAICGKRWMLRFERLPRNKLGETNWTRRQIIVDHRQHRSEQGLLDTIIHELKHATGPYLSEDAVAASSVVISRVLHRLYRIR